VTNVSPSYFSSIFSQEKGITFIEFLTNVRIEKAKELLRSTTLRSSEISQAVGYKDSHYFSYLFKKETGLTPREYRTGKEENN
jgi:two-component system response regulator YesN